MRQRAGERCLASARTSAEPKRSVIVLLDCLTPSSCGPPLRPLPVVRPQPAAHRERLFAIMFGKDAPRRASPTSGLCGYVRSCADRERAKPAHVIRSVREHCPTSRAASSRARSARNWRAGASPGAAWPTTPRSASRRWRRRCPAAARSRSPPRSASRRRSASACAAEAVARAAGADRQHRSRPASSATIRGRRCRGSRAST